MLGLENAVLHNRPRQIRLLLNLGSNINSKNADGKTPLMLCCEIEPESKARKMATFLHKLGARLDLRDKHQHTALMIGVMKKKYLVVDYFVSNCAEFDVNACDSDKNTALHLAVKSGNTGIVQLIVKAMVTFRLDLSICNNMGLTPLMLSIINRHNDIETYLRQVQSAKNVPSEHPVFVVEPKWKRNCKVFNHPHVNSSGGSVLNDKTLNSRDILIKNSQREKTRNDTWFSDKNSWKEFKPSDGRIAKLLPKTPVKYPNRKSINAASKLQRLKTVPKIDPKKATEKDDHLSTTDAFELNLAGTHSDYVPTENQTGWSLPEIFDLWQSQLCVSYFPSAVPKYEHYHIGPERVDSVLSSLYPRSPSGFRGRSVMSIRSVTPFGEAPNPAKFDTLTLPSTVPVRMKSAGRVRSDSRVSQLKVTTDRRSRSASPRPVIMVVPA